MRQDPQGRVACETLVTTGLAVIAGEITTTAHIDYDDLVRSTIRGVGYDRAKFGYDSETCAVMCTVKRQSPDIAMGVDTGGAGDQGLMFGFACDETPELMPLPIMMAHKLVRQLSEVRRAKGPGFLRPDGNSQVRPEYSNRKPKHIDRLVRASQIVVDTHGGMGRHGGGAFSGKDPTKVDRSACYMARYVAKNLVAAGLATRCEVQLAYAIGVAEPVSVMVHTFGTGVVEEE